MSATIGFPYGILPGRVFLPAAPEAERMAILNIGRHAPWGRLRTTFRRRPVRGTDFGVRMAADQTMRSGKDNIMFR